MKYIPRLSANIYHCVTNPITVCEASQLCNHVFMDAVNDKCKPIWYGWAVCQIANSNWVLRVGLLLTQCCAKSSPTLSKYHCGTNPIVVWEASTPCNYVCMDAVNDNCKSIWYELAVCRIANSDWVLRVGLLLQQYCSKSSSFLSIYLWGTNPITVWEAFLHHAITIVWILLVSAKSNPITVWEASTPCNHVCMYTVCKITKSPFDVNRLFAG